MICSTTPLPRDSSYLPGGRREVHRLTDPVEEFLPFQRAVVHRAREPEAVIDQGSLTRHVPLVHRADLRHGVVGLVDDQQKIFREIVEQGVRCGTGLPAVDVPGVVFDSGAEADLTHHLYVVGGPHPQPLRLQQLVLPLHLVQSFGQLGARFRRWRVPSAPARRRSGWPGRPRPPETPRTISPVSGCR